MTWNISLKTRSFLPGTKSHFQEIYGHTPGNLYSLPISKNFLDLVLKFKVVIMNKISCHHHTLVYILRFNSYFHC